MKTYRIETNGYRFHLDPANVETLKRMADFEGREEPAVAEEFLRLRAEGWAESLADAGAPPAEISVQIDPHQRKTHLLRGAKVLFSADI